MSLRTATVVGEIADTHSWCQPCRVLTPLLAEVTEPGTGYDLMTINVDDHPDLAGQFKVRQV